MLACHGDTRHHQHLLILGRGGEWRHVCAGFDGNFHQATQAAALSQHHLFTLGSTHQIPPEEQGAFVQRSFSCPPGRFHRSNPSVNLPRVSRKTSCTFEHQHVQINRGARQIPRSNSLVQLLLNHPRKRVKKKGGSRIRGHLPAAGRSGRLDVSSCFGVFYCLIIPFQSFPPDSPRFRHFVCPHLRRTLPRIFRSICSLACSLKGGDCSTRHINHGAGCHCTVGGEWERESGRMGGWRVGGWRDCCLGIFVFMSLFCHTRTHTLSLCFFSLAVEGG